MPDHDVLLERLVDDLSACGVLAPQWRSAFLSVPRHMFIPDTVWQADEDGDEVNDLIPLRRADEPQRWLQLAYLNRAVITRADDGYPAGVGLAGFEATSSPVHRHFRRSARGTGTGRVSEG